MKYRIYTVFLLYYLSNISYGKIIQLKMILMSYFLAKTRDVPKISPFKFKESIEIGKFTTVICSLESGSGSIKFNWKKNGHLVKSNKGLEISQTSISSILTINPVKASSSGNYTCEASNTFGTDSHTANLIVNGIIKLLNYPYFNSFL